MKQLFVKVITLILFVTLVGAFIAFRTGAINKIFTVSDKDKTLNTAFSDSTKKADSIKRVIMSSSKSTSTGFTFDHFSGSDSEEPETFDSMGFYVMSSSKSMLILTRNDPMFHWPFDLGLWKSISDSVNRSQSLLMMDEYSPNLIYNHKDTGIHQFFDSVLRKSIVDSTKK